MITAIDCLGCLPAAMIKLIKKCTDDPKKQMELGRDIFRMVGESDFHHNPVIISERIMSYIRKATGVDDPFHDFKRGRNQKALQLIPWMREFIDSGGDRLFECIKAAAAGNILDVVAVGNDKLLEKSIEHAFQYGFARSDYDAFQELLSVARDILYISDNSGEIVFDGLLAEELFRLGKKITFCVRGEPAMDDALAEDFREAGLDRWADMIDTGTGHMGFVPGHASTEAMEAFNGADLIIAKGMGNFESLMDMKDPRLFFVLKAKCWHIAGKIGVKKDDICFLQGSKIFFDNR